MTAFSLAHCTPETSRTAVSAACAAVVIVCSWWGSGRSRPGRRCRGLWPGLAWKRRSRRLLVTTNTDENAIAAPAISGLSSPAIASGSAATL